MQPDEGLKVYLREIDKEIVLAPGEEAGDHEIRAWMIRVNLRLVVKIALEQRGSAKVPVLDLISEGNVGLMKAVERFDRSKEGEFWSFARWWIRQAVKRALRREAKKMAAFCAPMKPDMGRDEDLALPA